jgi:ribosomal protein S18 acetylase RimI-like enzyme
LYLKLKAMIEIVEYRPEHQPHFERMNSEWISENFDLEPVDLYVLQNPEEAIINKGGAILMALYNGEVAGTAGLRKIDNDTYEFTKMTVDKNFRRKGIAETLCYASFDKARELGAKTVILYSNTVQAAAIKMYEKIGFQHLPVENTVYKRANVKMTIDLNTVSKKQIINA